MTTDERDYVEFSALVERASQALNEFGAGLREVLAHVVSAMAPALQTWSDAEATTHEGQPCPLGLDHEARERIEDER